MALAAFLVVGAVACGGGTTNLASEIAETANARPAVEIAPGTPLPLIPEVSLTINNLRWTISIVASPARDGTGESRIAPSDPNLRFLVVDYEIVNGSGNRLARDGLVELVRVTSDDGTVVVGTDIETYRLSRSFRYGASVADPPLLEVPPDLTYNGSWFFELDSTRPGLRLVSDLLGFELPLPADVHNPLIN